VIIYPRTEDSLRWYAIDGLSRQVTAQLRVPVRRVSADEPTLQGPNRISQQWEAARFEATSKVGAVPALDEIQKIPAWSETVKRCWDEDTRKKHPLKVILLGSARFSSRKALPKAWLVGSRA